MTEFFLIRSIKEMATRDFPAPHGKIIIPLLAKPYIKTFFKALY
jgi:hypothetical protein